MSTDTFNAPLYNFFKLETDNSTSAYLVESTARINIDELPSHLKTPNGTNQIEDEALFFEDIAKNIDELEDPELLIAVHGFNSDRNEILETYVDLFNSVAIQNSQDKRRAVCIGYRWPSEPIQGFLSFTDITRSFLSSAPSLLKILITTGFVTILSALYLLLFQLHTGGIHFAILTLATIGAILIAIPIIFWVLRLMVYFRDGYRATTYGIHGLVELLARIHHSYLSSSNSEFTNSHKASSTRNVKLVFVGHSMGAQVVTGAIKILADSLDRPREALNEPVNKLPDKQKESARIIGRFFQLERLILISPDIPAEVLISRRNNFLVLSLQLFNEAILFSSEADVVLKQLSRTANYFSYPTKSSDFGYRLGNLAIISDTFGQISLEGNFLDRLKLGSLTLHQISKQLGDAKSALTQNDLAEIFSYFDCTSANENGRGLLSPANRGDVYELKFIKEIQLLYNYLISRNPDVHSGYFASTGLRKLIFRLALHGMIETNALYANEGGLNEACKKLQVKFYTSLIF